MADLTGRRDRAQLLLVTAFALAAIFLGLAIIVNSAIFTENLATRSENVDSTEALEYRHTTAQLTAEVIGYANTFDDSKKQYDGIYRNVSRGVRELNDYSGRQQAQGGAGVALALDDTTNGSRIFQVDGTTFESNDSQEDWTLTASVDRTRAFRVTDASISGSFEVVVDDGTDQWRARLTDSSITVDAPGGSGSCTVSGSIETVNLTGARVNGEVCPALIDTPSGQPLRFGAGVGPGYEIRFEDSNEITGNFSLVVDDKSLSASNSNYAGFGGPGNGPLVTDAIYSATVEMEYQTPEVDYRTFVRVAPGEPR